MTHAFFVTTFYLPNLRISLSSIQRYIKQNQRYCFNLLVSNDNPNFTLTEEFVSKFIDLSLLKKVVVLNTDKNLGCFHNRIKCIKTAYKEFPNCKNFMFVDDDDVVLNPSFDTDNFWANHRAVVTHRLLEVLTLIDEPVVNLQNKNFEYEEWKSGCVGNVFNLSLFHQFITDAEDWFPELYKIYGSERIMEPDDVIIWHMWFVWIGNTFGNYPEKQDYVDRFSYSLTYLEDRLGRYYVEPGICDLRYGEYDGHSHYFDLYNPIWNEFDRYMKRKLGIPFDENAPYMPIFVKDEDINNENNIDNQE